MAAQESEGLSNGRLWLMRARQDYSAFKRLVPLTRNNYRTVRVSDPALAVYLLQQTHEKAAKALALASGRYGKQDVKRRFGHQSPAALLETLVVQFDVLVDLGMGPLLDMAGKPHGEQSSRLKWVLSQLGAWRSQFALEGPENVLALLDLLKMIREVAVLGSLRRVWGPHTSLIYEPSQSVVAASPPDLLAQVEEFWTTSLGQAKPRDEFVGAMRAFLDSLRARGLLDDGMVRPQRTVVRRSAEEMLQPWAVCTLLMLSALTWPHEATARYPRWECDRDGMAGALGIQDYASGIGIVAHLGYAGYLTGLALQHLDGVMESTATLFGLKGST